MHRPKDNESDIALQTCLKMIREQGETVETALRRFPEQAEALRPELEAALWLKARRQSFDPRPGFITASRRRLQRRIMKEGNAATFPRMAWALRFVRLEPKKLAIYMALVFLVVGQLLNGARLLSASRAWLPGDALYPLKTVFEDTKLAFTLDAAGKARLHISFAQQRLMEIQALIFEGDYEEIAGAVGNYENHVDQAVRAINRLAGRDLEQARGLAERLQAALPPETKLVVVLAGLTPQQTRDECQRVRMITESGASAIEDVLSPSGYIPKKLGSIDFNTLQFCW